MSEPVDNVVHLPARSLGEAVVSGIAMTDRAPQPQVECPPCEVDLCSECDGDGVDSSGEPCSACQPPGTMSLLFSPADLADLESMVTFVDCEQRFPATRYVIAKRAAQVTLLAQATAVAVISERRAREADAAGESDHRETSGAPSGQGVCPSPAAEDEA